MTSTMVQGSCSDGQITTAMKGNGREVALIVRKLMVEMADGLNCSLDEVAKSIVAMQEEPKKMTESVKFETQPIPKMNDEVASFFKRHEEPIKKQQPIPEPVQEPASIEPEEPEFYSLEEGTELAPEPEAEPILKILMNHGIDSVYERKVEHSLPGAEWFDCEYDAPNGKYYLLLENKKSTSPKDKLKICSAMRINGKWALSSTSKVSLSDCSPVGYTSHQVR